MTRKEAIKRLEGMFDCLVLLDGGVAADEDYEAFDMALDALRRTAWISVKDDLPDLYDDVLVMLSNGSMTVDYTWDSVQGKVRWSEYFSNQVIAWMPLPEPYREVEE